MKRKSLIIILACEAGLLFTLVLLTNQFPGYFSSILAFPFEQIAIGLTALSQSGQLGNGLALALWIGVSMLPIIPALRYERDKATLMERIVLYALSCVLLLELYRMVNSQVFFSLISVTKSEYLAVVKAIIGVSVWSVIVLYIVLRLTRLFRSGDKASLLRYLRGLLYVLCLLFTAAAVVPFISGIMTSIGTSRKALDSAIDIVRMLVVFVPFVLDLAIIMRALDLLDIAMTDNQNGILNAAERLSKICCIALGTTTAITAVFNVVQVILMRWLSNVATTVDIPIISIVFICIVLLLSKLLVENKALRDDNRLII